MKRLNELIKCEYDTPVYGIKTNSKDVKQGDLFIAIHGFNCDHHDFIDDAIKRGAVAVISEKKIITPIPIVIVKSTNTALKNICYKFYSNVEKEFTMIGITGTDGKTTTSTIIYNVLKDIMQCCNIGTNGLVYKGITKSLDNTTPELEKIYNELLTLNKRGCKTISMEVSSESLLHKRVDNFIYDIAILTNITEDHLNIHKSIENYVNTKGRLFEKVKKDGYCILNKEDKNFELIKKHCKAKIYTYGMSDNCDFKICKISCKDKCNAFSILHNDNYYPITTNLIGKYNIYNITAAFACCYLLKVNPNVITDKISSITNIKGRGEKIDFGQPFTIILDYAHTENGIKNILSTLKVENYKRIITVTGSAGGREKEKRSKMGKAVLNLSDYVIFTMDDPRHEKVSDIINDLIGDSIKTNYEKIEDREKAIFKALDMAHEGDVIAILGKGKDNYMAIESKKIPYSDYKVIEKYFRMKST